MAEKGGMAPFPGGCLITKADKNADDGDKLGEKLTARIILGAIGVSGASGYEDEVCALAGISFYENSVEKE